jgi:ABC-type Fe3+-hydroxamate transport system substrate-binding protein
MALNLPAFTICSAVPSLTETLCYLGLEEQLIGVTKFCIHPTNKLKNKKKIGGTKNLNINVINKLNPTYIIATKEENVKEQIEAINNTTTKLVFNIYDLKTTINAIQQLGKIFNIQPKANTLAAEIETRFKNSLPYKGSCIYLIWQKPFYTIGGDTFIHSMLRYAGFTNLTEKQKRYPAITIEQIKEWQPNFLFLSSEPYPFKENHIQQLQKQLQHTKVCLIDGEMTSWYGSRMLQAPDYFKKFLL